MLVGTIGTGSCTNVVSEEAVKKLGLKIEPHQEPYHVSWITNTKLKVKDRCPITFTIGNLKEIDMCDALSIKHYHILLGQTWIWDPDVQHPGRANTYSFNFTYAKAEPKLKLKSNSFLIQRTFPCDGILGAAPNWPESSPFQQSGIDGACIDWLNTEHIYLS